MGTIKKYHFMLFISEEQEHAIRHLFLLNKWDLHGKALSQLAAILKDLQSDLPDGTHAVQNDSQQQQLVHNDPGQQQPVQSDFHQQLTVQNDSHQQLTIQNNSHRQPVQTDSYQQLPEQGDSSPVSVDKPYTYSAQGKKYYNARQLVSQNIQEIEKEVYQNAASLTLDESVNDGSVNEKQTEYTASTCSRPVNGIEFITSTVSAARGESERFKEMGQAVANETCETRNSNMLCSTVNGAVNVAAANLASSYVENSHSVPMDPLAKASEIAGIPFQQPDGSLFYSPHSGDYQRYENFYPLPESSYPQQPVFDSVQSEHQQQVLDAIETGVQSQGSGIEQLLKASAVIPSDYSVDDQRYVGATTSVSTSFSGTGIQALENQIPVSSFASNVISAPKASITNSGRSQHNVTEVKITQLSDHKIKQKDENMVVSMDSNVEPAKSNDFSNSRSICKSNKELLVTDTGKTQLDISEAIESDEMLPVSVPEKDYIEIDFNGSLIKIPIVTKCYKNILEQEALFTQGSPSSKKEDEQNSMREVEKNENRTKDVPSYTVIKPKVKSVLHVDIKQNLKKKTVSDEESKQNSIQDLTAEHDNLGKEQKRDNKRKKNMIGENEKGKKKQKAEEMSTNENYFENKISVKTVKDIKQNEVEKSDCRPHKNNNNQIISKATKTYSTRFRIKKEMLENAKKKMERTRRHHPKKSKFEQENVNLKPVKANKSKQNKVLKNDTTTQAMSRTKQKNDKKKKKGENIFQEEKGKTKSIDKKPRPPKLEKETLEEVSETSEKETQEKVSETLEDQVVNRQQNEIDSDTDPVEDVVEALDIKEEIKTEHEVKHEVNEAEGLELKEKIIKTKKGKPKAENENTPKVKCTECGNYCNKKGYCKTCRISCPHCDKSFTRCPSALKLYQTHVKKHIDDPKPYPCADCDMKFSSEWFLNRHIENKHTNKCDDGPFLCQICQKRFTTKYSLKGHLNHVHGERKRDVLCDLCGEFFLSQGYLRQHRQYVHQEERNFTCKLCFVSVKTEVLLKRHMARHTEEKNEVCNICGRSFRVRSDLLRHMVRHDSNRRSFKCETCGKGFFEDQKLKQHIRIHTGVKPYKCNLCPYACAVKGNLTKHLKTHANREGYLGRAYKRKSKISKFGSQYITDPGPVQLQIEVITTDDNHMMPDMSHYDKQELVQYDPVKYQLPPVAACKQELQYVEMRKNDLVQFDTSKEEMPQIDVDIDKQDLPHYETGKQELPPFEAVKPDMAQFETLRESSEQERGPFVTVQQEHEPVRVYYEAVQPDDIDAGRSYLDQEDLKDYKEMSDGESYINQINLSMIANNYKNGNKIDFYNI